MTTEQQQRQEPAQPTFEEALARLETLVAQLESGGLTLAQSMLAFEEGMRLNAFCSPRLAEAEPRIERLVRSREAGELSWEPMNVPQQPSQQS